MVGRWIGVVFGVVALLGVAMAPQLVWAGPAVVTAGLGSSRAILEDGSLWAWGDNDTGELGDGTTIRRGKPVQVGSATNWSRVIAGESHTLAIRSDGSLWTWGERDGATR